MDTNQSTRHTFRYVYRKDLGYYTVSIDEPYWDKEKQQTRHRYTLVGKSMTKNGPIEFGPKYRAQQAQQRLLEGLTISRTISEGELLVLRHIEQQLSLNQFLVQAFGATDAQAVLVLAYYTICTHEPVSGAAPWLEQRGLEQLSLDAPRVSELLPRITADAQKTFFSAWMKQKAAGGALCYDISSLSSYGRNNDLIEYGYNRDQEPLKQINLALLSGKSTGLPVWYTPLPGSLHDGKTLKALVREIQKLNVGTFTLVMDRGFYSRENLQFLADNRIKFMIPIPNRTNWHKQIIQEYRGKLFSHVDRYIPSEDGSRYIQSLTVYHPFADGTRAWLHIYYDSTIRSHAEQQFMAYYKMCFDEYVSGDLNPAHHDFYAEYFTRGYKTKNGQKVLPLKDPVEEFRGDIAGYWCIYTTSEKDAKKALAAYRERNDIEQLFDDLKNSLDCRRLRVHTKPAMYGRLFIQFIALIILTELKQQLRHNHAQLAKYGNYTSILHRVASFSRIRFKGKYKDLHSTPTKGQEVIFNALGVDYPKQ